jgi:hypothetical protein
MPFGGEAADTLQAVKNSERAYLSICAIYRDEAPYMPEWLEFHRLLGVERFYMWNNRSSDNHMEVLAPYIEEGIVVWRDWPMFPGQRECYEQCLADYRRESRWIAFIDLDEFLFSPTRRLLTDVLSDFEAHPGVVVNMLYYGTSGHETPPPGLVIENYTRRLGLARPRNRHVKSIVNPERTLRIGHVAHYFIYADRTRAVDERFRPSHGHETNELSVDLLRINHYFTRSQDERRAKIARPGILHGQLIPRPEEAAERDQRLNEELDDVLVPIGRAVRAALAARAAGNPLPAGALEAALGTDPVAG